MLIDNVEIVDNPQGIIQRVGGIVRLKRLDQSESLDILDQFYFSFVTSAVVRIGRPLLKNREVNPFVFRCSSDREMPSDVVKTGSQMVEDSTDCYEV